MTIDDGSTWQEVLTQLPKLGDDHARLPAMSGVRAGITSRQRQEREL